MFETIVKEYYKKIADGLNLVKTVNGYFFEVVGSDGVPLMACHPDFVQEFYELSGVEMPKEVADALVEMEGK